MSEEKRETKKSTSYTYTLVPRQKAIGCCAREKAASKSDLLGRWKTQSALRGATFLLPSVFCRVLSSRVFILLLNFKLENVAIKLLEIALGKHKFPKNNLLKRGNFVEKKTLLLTA
jgi:hypothetical protein